MDSESIKQEIGSKLVIVLAITLFTVILWGGVVLIDSVSPRDDVTEYKKYTRPITDDISLDVLDEFATREADYQPISNVDYKGEDTSTDTTETEN